MPSTAELLHKLQDDSNLPEDPAELKKLIRDLARDNLRQQKQTGRRPGSVSVTDLSPAFSNTVCDPLGPGAGKKKPVKNGGNSNV